MLNVAAIVLAAGHSRRMGAANKLLLQVGEHAMIRHVVGQYRAAIDGPITVVTGHDADSVQFQLRDLDVECVFNPDHEKGQQTSVAYGLSHARDADVLLIGLGDQPLLRSADICDLVRVHSSISPTKISIPVNGAARGNPIVVPHTLRPNLTADPSRPGCMRFTRENPEYVQRHTLAAIGFYADIDTPNDYAALSQKKELTS